MSNYHLRPIGITHCKKCGKELTAKQRKNRQSYCSKICAGSKPVPICRCETCGKTFKPIANDRLRYCSRRCSGIDNHGKPIKIKDHWPEKSCRVYFKECLDCGTITTLCRNCKTVRCNKCKTIRWKKKNTEHRRVKKGLTELTRSCVKCGELFKTYRSRKKTCSEMCSKRLTKQRENNKRRATQYGEKHIENVDIAVLYSKDGGRCQLCNRKLNLKRIVPHLLAATIDHIKPLSDGGEHSYKNTQLTCFKCNSLKGDRMVEGGEQLRLLG